MRGESRHFIQSLLIWLGLAYLTNAQSQSCPPITVNDLGSPTSFSSNGLIPRALVPLGSQSIFEIPVRIIDYTIVCDAAGIRKNTSSYVSVVVRFQCDSSSASPTLSVCDGNTIVTRQYQFQCLEFRRNGQLVIDWAGVVSGSNLFIQTLNPTATLCTPRATQCRRCVDDQQSSRPIDPTTHCDREFKSSIIIFFKSCLSWPFSNYHVHSSQHVNQYVTRDRGVAFLGQLVMCAVTSTSKVTV